MENLIKQILENADNGIFNHIDESIADQYIAVGYYRSSGSPSAWTDWYEVVDIPSSDINDVLDEFNKMYIENESQNSHITYGSNLWDSRIQFNIKLFYKE